MFILLTYVFPLLVTTSLKQIIQLQFYYQQIMVLERGGDFAMALKLFQHLINKIEILIFYHG